jgi:hypothetical protein
MLNRPCRSLLAVLFSPLALALSTLALAGCGDKLSDDAYGFIDLAPYYYDGSSVTNPSGGLVREIAPQPGWLNGVRAQYYDFGLVGFVKKRTDGKLPDYASVPPMYFFFDSAGNPLTSRAVYEARSGQWWMKGGVSTLDVNPRDDARRDVPYAERVRGYFLDDKRQSYDYQRPIVDRLQHNTDYSGLWEIYTVTVPDDYKPDDIKSYATLQTALASGKGYFADRTKSVINCPVIDDRQVVTTSPLWYGVPHPRIELWYRTKMGSCFLADGWLALGPFPAANSRKAELYSIQDNARRFNMFDVVSYTIGDGLGARTTVVAPVMKMYVPKVTVLNQDPAKTASDIRYVGDNVTDIGPRFAPNNPPGYSPLKWLWDLKVPQDPPYQAGTYKRSDQMDPANLSNRLTSDTPFVKNFPLIGQYQGCAADADCSKWSTAPGIHLECNKTPNADLATSDFPGVDNGKAPDADPVRVALLNQIEGGARCDVPAARFGEFCAPGIARCKLDIRADMDAKPVSDDKAATTGVAGYTCQPMGTGYCMFRCDVDGSAGSTPAMAIPVNYPGPSGTVKMDTGSLPFDARCGNIPGYKCLNPAPKTPTVPNRMRVCLRQCDTAKPDNYNDVFCSYKTTVSINEKVQKADIQKGMTCSNRGIDSAAGCQWDPAFEPRDQSSNFVVAP